MNRGGAQREWVYRGNAIRVIGGLPHPDFGMLRCGRALALVPAGLSDAEYEVIFRRLLRRWQALPPLIDDHMAAAG